MDEKLYCISYDLIAPGRDYEELYKAIKSFSAWWHQTESVWFVKSSNDAAVIRDYLKQSIDTNDKLFVIQVVKNWGGIGFTKKEYDWLNKHFKQSK